MNEPVAAPAPITTPESELEAVPSSWPGAFGAYKFSKAAVMFNLGTYLTVLAISIGFTLVMSIVGGAIGLPEALNQLLQNAVSFTLSLTAILVLFAGVARVKKSFNEALEETWPLLVRFLLQMVLLAVIAVASLILLIIPFFIIMPRLALAPYILVKEKLGVVEALQASWDRTKGHVGKVWGLVGVNILIALLFVTIIGIPFAVYFYIMYSAAWNVLYAYVVEHNSAASQQPAAA